LRLPWRPGLFKFHNPSFEVGYARSGTLEDPLLHFEVFPCDQIKTIEKSGKQLAQVLFDIAGGRRGQDFRDSGANLIHKAGVGHGKR
jgi:hypothetical protein